MMSQTSGYLKHQTPDDEKEIEAAYRRCKSDIGEHLRKIQDEAYELGLLRGNLDALRRFAWVKDGVEYVGIRGMTLTQAIEDVNDA